MRVVVVRPGAIPTVEDWDASFRALQVLVGGNFLRTVWRLRGARLDVWVNEDGTALDLPANRALPGGARAIVGTFVVSMTGREGELVALSEATAARVVEVLS